MDTPSADQQTPRIPTAQLIASMLKSREQISDLIFSPGRAPQVEVRGELVELRFRGLETLTPQHTHEFAEDLIGGNANAAQQLARDGSADLSYAVPGLARFRVNVFRQRGTYSIVMRVIPVKIPSFD